MCDLCIETTCTHCKKYDMCLELLDGLYFCDECLNDIMEIKCLGEIEESIPVIKIKK